MSNHEDISGLRCSCGHEICHAVHENPKLEKIMLDAESAAAQRHRARCPGTVERFTSQAGGVS